MDDWLTEHMHGVLVTIEVLWVSGFLAVFVVYFIIKYRLKRKRDQQEMDDSENRR